MAKAVNHPAVAIAPNRPVARPARQLCTTAKSSALRQKYIYAANDTAWRITAIAAVALALIRKSPSAKLLMAVLNDITLTARVVPQVSPMNVDVGAYSHVVWLNGTTPTQKVITALQLLAVPPSYPMWVFLG